MMDNFSKFIEGNGFSLDKLNEGFAKENQMQRVSLHGTNKHPMIMVVEYLDCVKQLFYVSNNQRSFITTMQRSEKVVVPNGKGDAPAHENFEEVKNVKNVYFYMVNSSFESPWSKSDEVDSSGEDSRLEAEEKRIEAINERIEGFSESTERVLVSNEVEVVEGIIAIVKEVNLLEFQEFEYAATEAKNHALSTMEAHLETLQPQEDEIETQQNEEGLWCELREDGTLGDPLDPQPYPQPGEDHGDHPDRP